MIKRIIFFLIILSLINISLSFSIEMEGLKEDRSEDDPLIFNLMPGFLGASVLFGYKGFEFIDGRNTIIWGGAGAFFTNVPFFRDFDDDLLTADNTTGIDIDEDLSFYKLNFTWTVGLTQGLIWNSKINANLLDISLFYKGSYDYHFENDEKDQVIFNQINPLPDMESIQQNSFITGLSLNNAFRRNHIIRGIYSEFSAEWGPGFMNKSADFVRLNFGLKAFIPVVELCSKNGEYFGINIGNYFVADWITGDSIPLNIRQTIGGFKSQRYGLGGTIRGVDNARYDSELKIADCFDIRFNLPIPLPLGIVPGLIIYFDSAYYNLMQGSDDGFLFSTGGGAFLNLKDRFIITVYTGAFLNGENVDGEKWKPVIFSMRFHF